MAAAVIGVGTGGRLGASTDDVGRSWCHHEQMRTLVIVDDHAAFRRWAGETLAEEGFEVVGLAENGAGAIAAVQRLRPDVLLLDVQLPDMSGFEVAELVAERTTVVLTSSRAAGDYGRLVPQSAAAGFVTKSDLSGANLRVAAGGGS